MVTLGSGMMLEPGKEISHRPVTPACYIRDTKNECIIVSTSQNLIPEVDTTSADNAFDTGFLYGLLKEKSLDKCGRLGHIVAQFSMAKLGAREGLSISAELAQRYHELYDREL